MLWALVLLRVAMLVAFNVAWFALLHWLLSELV